MSARKPLEPVIRPVHLKSNLVIDGRCLIEETKPGIWLIERVEEGTQHILSAHRLQAIYAETQRRL